jgi:AcrR family transcriptional regulator
MSKSNAMVSTAATESVREEFRDARQRAVADMRKSLVLDAARSAFFERGIEGASIREIAKRAGYTPGAIYSYYASKEEMYGALLGESLERLNQQVEAAAPLGPRSAPTAAGRREAALATLRAKANAFFDFYHDNPRDLDLGFYLFQRMQPREPTLELNEQLNARLRDALLPIQQALTALGMEAKPALAEVAALLAHTVGLLVLGHTGRIRMFKQESQGLFEKYLNALVDRSTRRQPAERRLRRRVRTSE